MERISPRLWLRRNTLSPGMAKARSRFRYPHDPRYHRGHLDDRVHSRTRNHNAVDHRNHRRDVDVSGSHERKAVNRNCLSYWFPKLLAAGVPVPRTEIVKTDAELIAILDGQLPDGWALI